MKEPDTDDYKKLACIMNYLQGTCSLPLTSEADMHRGRSSVWVDGAFALHPDMKSHTGRVMSLRGGAVYTASTQQKLNMKSSTEVELVAVDDVMPQIIWMQNFLESGIHSTRQHHVPGQPECNVTGEEWEVVKQ